MSLVSWPGLFEKACIGDYESGGEALSELCGIDPDVGERATLALQRTLSENPRAIAHARGIEMALAQGDPEYVSNVLVDDCGLSDLDALDAVIELFRRFEAVASFGS